MVPEPVDSGKAVPASAGGTEEPIATPCRALIQYWEKFRVPKTKTPSPTPTTLDSSESSVVSVPQPLLPDNQLGDTMIQQEIQREANGLGDEQPEATEAAGTAATLPPTEVVNAGSETPPALCATPATPPALPEPNATPPALPEPNAAAVATPPVLPEPKAAAVATPPVLPEPKAAAVATPPVLPEPKAAAVATPTALAVPATPAPLPEPTAPTAVATPPALPEPMISAVVPTTPAQHVPLATPATVAAALSRATTVDLLGRDPSTVLGHAVPPASTTVPVPMEVDPTPAPPLTMAAPAAVVPAPP